MNSKIATAAFEMQYIKFGKGEKTLVILPGLSVQSVIPSAALIEKQYEVFSRDFTVYLFDRRENLPQEYSVADMARDTAAAIKALGLSNVCLFGVSQGGMIAMQLASDYPELVSRLALGSAACRIDEKAALAIDEWIALAESGNAEALYLAFGERLYSAEVYEKYKPALILAARTVTQSDLQRFITLARGTAGFDITKKLCKITCPVFALGDTEDKLFGANATQKIAEHFGGNADFEAFIYSGYGHAVYDTAPDFAQRLHGFFN